MQNTQNPYWDEIKERLDEVVDGMSFGFPRLSRYKKISAWAGEQLSKDVLDSLLDHLWIPPTPSLETFDEKTYLACLYHHRNELCQKYTWAIPNPEALDFLVEHCGSSVVEIGAGTGYWAWQLAQRGVDVLAYDIAPPHLSCENQYHSPRSAEQVFTYELRDVYHPIEIGGPAQCAEHPDRTLFLCWPPYTDEMAAHCLQYYTGDRLIYIGEGDGGCTADDAFFEHLENDWEEKVSHKLVQWDGIHDEVVVYGRKGVHSQLCQPPTLLAGADPSTVQSL